MATKCDFGNDHLHHPDERNTKHLITGRVDFHLHSDASNVTTYYAANAFSIPESFSDPFQLYSVLKQRGMALVTLTDHNSIDGALRLLDRGFCDVFLSAEITTTFPEDGCNIHITVANVSEAQFREVNRLRGNIYEMVAYIEAEIALEELRPGCNRLAAFMTHPLMSTENRAYGREGAFNLSHIEKALLLLRGFEVRNGSRTATLNGLTERLLLALTPERIEDLANRHDLRPLGDKPWLKYFVGGSDDHSGINPGNTWTEFEFAGAGPSANDLITSMGARTTRVGGIHGGPITLAHSLLKLLYDGSKRSRMTTKPFSAGAGKSVVLGGAFNALLEIVFDSASLALRKRLWFRARTQIEPILRRLGSGRYQSIGMTFEQVLDSEVYRLLADTSFRTKLSAIGASTDDKIFLVVSTLVNNVFARYVENIKRNVDGNLISTVKEMVAMFASNIFVSLPYLVSFFQQASDSMVSRDVRKAFGIRTVQKLVLATDTFFEVNGVSATIKRMIRESARRGLEFTVVTCLSKQEQIHHLRNPEVCEWIGQGRLKVLTSISELDFPEYEGLKIRIPPLLEMLHYFQESGCTKIQISTPGSVGLSALAAAKTLQLETAATYHTSFPEYVENYTHDISLEELTWKYMMAFYHSVDEVVVPSRFIAKHLHRRGLRNRKLLILDRWVDVERFHPRNREQNYWQQFGIKESDKKVKFVYVGRIGKEKNLALLAAAFKQLHTFNSEVHLFVIGDGPYRIELEEMLADLPVTFTGFIEGDELPRAIASCDVKLFPSTTDTWGNAPLEAQASGLPVIVSDVGGPQELMLPGVTGFKICGHSTQAMVDAMTTLLNPLTREHMGQAARLFSEDNVVDLPFSAVLESESYRKRVAESEALAKSGRGQNAVTMQVFDLASETFENMVGGEAAATMP